MLVLDYLRLDQVLQKHFINALHSLPGVTKSMRSMSFFRISPTYQ